MNSIANYRSIAGRCGGLPIIAVMMLGFASTAVLPDPALAQGKNPKKIIKKMDRSGDGKISRKEWRKSPDMFDSLDADGDGFVTYEELAVRFGGGKKKSAQAKAPPAPARAPVRSAVAEAPGPPPGRVGKEALDRETLCGISRSKKCHINVAIKLGLFETGLRPQFPAGLKCRDIDEQWAISYTAKRDRVAYHGGIDMPAPWGTPMLAMADGTVIAKYVGENSYRGKEIILRHAPEDTGLPLWIYSQYSHFNEMPKHEIGQRVRMGEVLGPTGNSGRGRKPFQQSQHRRPAIHFAIWYSDNPNYVPLKHKVIPVQGQWMDPNAIFRKRLPLDSYSLRDLPEAEKKVPISVMVDDGEFIPADTKLIWPYSCSRQ